MNCIFCNSKTRVIDKRESPEGTRRRRECIKCKRRFTTYEKPVEKELRVIKKDGRREIFLDEKLRLGILKSCEKRRISIDKIDKIVKEIKKNIRKKGKEVSTKKIGELVMNRLKKLDKIAYIRFASVYKEFKDVSDFKKEVKGL